MHFKKNGGFGTLSGRSRNLPALRDQHIDLLDDARPPQDSSEHIGFEQRELFDLAIVNPVTRSPPSG